MVVILISSLSPICFCCISTVIAKGGEQWLVSQEHLMDAVQYWILFWNQRLQCHVISYLSHTRCPKNRGHVWNLVSETLTYSLVLDCLAIKAGSAALIIQWENDSGDRQNRKKDCSRKYLGILNRVGVVGVVYLHWVSETPICHLSPIQQKHEEERLKAFFRFG